MLDKNVIISYYGILDFDTIEILLNKSMQEMDAINTDKSIKKRVVNVMVECLENSYKHSDYNNNNSLDVKNYSSKFIFELQDDMFVVTVGNIISSKSIEALKNKIELVNKLSKDSLKKLYKEVITKGQISDKGGAGLGIIDIAIKSGNKIQYKFDPINSDLSYYVIKTRISKTKI